MKLRFIIGKFLEIGTILSAIGFITSTLVQIYARFFLDSAPPWTEEAARVFFIYAMSFAAGLALRDDFYVHLDLVYNRLKPSSRKLLEQTILVLTCLLFAVLGWYAIHLVQLGAPENSPSIGFSMAWAFASMLIMAIGIIYFAFAKLIKKS